MTEIFYYAGNINKTPIFVKILKYFIKSKNNNKVIQQYIHKTMLNNYLNTIVL